MAEVNCGKDATTQDDRALRDPRGSRLCCATVARSGPDRMRGGHSNAGNAPSQNSFKVALLTPGRVSDRDGTRRRSTDYSW